MTTEEKNTIMTKLLKKRIYPFNDQNIRGKFRIDVIKVIPSPYTYTIFNHIKINVSIDAEWYTVSGYWAKPNKNTRKHKKIANAIIRDIVLKTMLTEFIMIGVNDDKIVQSKINVKWTDII
jgi:hypothetical protein